MQNHPVYAADRLLLAFLLLLGPLLAFGQSEAPISSWWPEQKIARGFVSAAPTGNASEQILLQGMAGLAAQAVNDNMGDELVWLPGGGEAYLEWNKRTVDRLKLENRGKFDVWNLLKRYRDSGLIKGYILYSRDANPGNPYSKQHLEFDYSLNVATTMAGLLQAVPVEVSLEGKVETMGLKKLGDARMVTPENLLRDKGSELNRKLVVLLDPKAAPMRDFAIAQRGFVDSMHGGIPPISLGWAEPNTPAIGWFCGDEFKNVAPVSRAGHMHTASNWATNIPFLSMGSAEYKPRKLRSIDPKKIDMESKLPSVAFMLSDGDNVCWMLGGFQAEQRGGKPSPFWDSPEHGKFPMGWSACLGDLVDIAPVAIDRLVETQPQQTSVTQFGGGYFYPDLYAINLPNRLDLLRQHARRMAEQMRKTGSVTLTFICEKSDSPAAQEAMQIFAEEIDPLLGMLVMDYAPYNRMQGKVYWFNDGRGGQVPAVTARYTMWANMKKPRAGGPAEVAAAIMSDAPEGGASWVAIHAWSKFDGPSGPLSVAGVNAAAECIEDLDRERVQVVNPEEMLWRLRYAHNPGETSELINRWKP
jgi:hypothetical protein